MATESSTPITPVTHTTQRGFATASCALSFWGLMVCWWYPFGMCFATFGVIIGLISIALGYRGGKDGEHLALAGVGFGLTAIGLAFGMFRFVQFAFEGSIAAPWMPVIALP